MLKFIQTNSTKLPRCVIAWIETNHIARQRKHTFGAFVQTNLRNEQAMSFYINRISTNTNYFLLTAARK